MTPASSPASPAALVLAAMTERYTAESQRIQQTFSERGNGPAVLQSRSDLVDAIVVELYQKSIAEDPKEPGHLCLVALGGYGRRELFPDSDIDLLFLTEDAAAQTTYRDAIATFLRILWDLRMRVGNSTHALAECGRLYRDNLEFNISLLDLRYLAGDADLYARLRTSVVPHMVARDRQELVRNLMDLTGQRHAKYGNTIFHLEPNLKDAPGCLRDYHVCRWLVRIEELERDGKWSPPEQMWPDRDRLEARRAFEFLADARCFLHYLYGRDDNQLSYDAQSAAAARGIGAMPGLSPADWMRIYFRKARIIDQLTAQLIDDSAPARSGLYALYRDWRSRLSNTDFSVIRGKVFVRHPTGFASDPLLLMRLFEMVARHGLPLGRETERLVEAELERAGTETLPPAPLWQHFARLLVQPCAAQALRTMHRLGLLARLFPEFQAIDSLVIRDFYHRYTVDEHSFTAVEKLHALLGGTSAGVPGSPSSPPAFQAWQKKFAEILSEVERPELLYLALLFHDLGKGFPEIEDHVQGSLRALAGIRARLDLGDEEWTTVQFLIASHLEMSAASQRRDVFDPETVRDFARVPENMERLKMLCLLTYADICAVNPEAMTPWKAELLWQLYAATANYLSRSVDDERLRIGGTPSGELEKTLAALGGPADAGALRAFLDGFPQRYTSTRTPEQIAGHFKLARSLADESIALELSARCGHFELTVVTADRPYLFASITGTLAAWGMSIVKADAFANAAGVILDTFMFVDLHRTLELNPSESHRMKQNLADVLNSTLELEKLLSGRLRANVSEQPKVKVSTRVRFDNQSSSHSTLLEIVAQDRPGLLFDISSVLADQNCNIEVALIDTEGQRAIDVFYLTCRGTKLDFAAQNAVDISLRKRL